MKNFVLSYNSLTLAVSADQVATWVKDCRHISQWYQPFPGTWLLKGDQPSYILTNSFKGVFPNVPFILAEASILGGAQDQRIWDWVNTSIVPMLTSS